MRVAEDSPSRLPALTIAERADGLYGQGKYAEAAQIYWQLAEQGDAQAQTRLGTDDPPRARRGEI